MNEPGDTMDVLVIDDEEGMREGIKRILVKRGFEVDLSRDGETAMEMLREHTYDLAFVDLKMPGIDGFQVTEYINEKMRTKTVVIIVSALATVEQRRLLREREKYLSELNNERNYSRQLINSMQEGVVVLNIRSEPVLMNPKAEYHLGVRFSDDPTIERLFGDPKVRDAIGQVAGMPVGTADPARLGVTKVLEFRQEDTTLQARISPLIRDSENGGAIVLVNDITEELKAEQDKNMFISIVAHKLKSPLAAIINYINVIQTGMFDQSPEKVHELLGRCIVRGDALLELIQDLLYINKRDAGKVEKSIHLVDLREVLADQLEFYRVRNARTGGITGTGLGLATVKRVLGEYNARISVASQQDQGSTFTVRFPSAQAC